MFLCRFNILDLFLRPWIQIRRIRIRNTALSRDGLLALSVSGQAPYIIYVEVVLVRDLANAVLPKKISNTLRQVSTSLEQLLCKASGNFVVLADWREGHPTFQSLQIIFAQKLPLFTRQEDSENVCQAKSFSTFSLSFFT